MIEGLWTLEQAATQIPMPTKRALEAFLQRHREIPRRYYRTRDKGGPRWGTVIRMLYDSEIKYIRDILINEDVGARYHWRDNPTHKSHKKRQQDSLVSWITQAANG